MAVKQKSAQTEQSASVDAASAGAEKKPRKPRTPRSWQWTPERQKALHRVLTSPKGEGTIRTAGAIAQALMELPEFQGIALSALEILSVVKAFAAGLEAEGKAIPACLKLDSARRRLDLSLFG